VGLLYVCVDFGGSFVCFNNKKIDFIINAVLLFSSFYHLLNFHCINFNRPTPEFSSVSALYLSILVFIRH
jgi:hypothetical protein